MIKKIVLCIILSLLGLSLRAPVDLRLDIPESPEPFHLSDKLIYAINMVEAQIDNIHFDTLAYHPSTQATGAFQITPIRLNDYNKRTGNHYILNDCFDYQISKKIFLYYYTGNFEQTAKLWYGLDKNTYKYWRAVKKWL
jgi:hypothetical protein